MAAADETETGAYPRHMEIEEASAKIRSKGVAEPCPRMPAAWHGHKAWLGFRTAIAG